MAERKGSIMRETEIVSVSARQVYSDREYPGVEATVITACGARGVAICTAGVSVGTHEIEFIYDGGDKWRGKGVLGAVRNVNELIAPVIVGMDSSKQLEIDNVILNIGGAGAKQRLGGNATAAVSAAVLKAGAQSLGIPLYQHIGGVNACILPVPGAIALLGSDRYGAGARSGGKPSYSFMAYGFETFSEASYAAWDLYTEWGQTLKRKLGFPSYAVRYVPTVAAGRVSHDREIWDLMVETIHSLGYEGKVGLQVDVAADTYYNEKTGMFEGLFSKEPKTRDDLFEIYETMVNKYPFVILEDPLPEDDYGATAKLTEALGIQIVGDDLFTTDPERLAMGIGAGAANTMLLKVNQIGTITEAFETVRMAYRKGYGIMPCSSRGEGTDIADYCVGLNTTSVRESAIGPTGNRFLQIESELGKRAVFLGKDGLKGWRFNNHLQ